MSDLLDPRARNALLRELSDLLTAAIPTGVGFALFLLLGSDLHYTSSGAREDVLPVLQSWLARTSAQDAVVMARAIVDQVGQSREGVALSELARSIVEGLTEGRGDEAALFLFHHEAGGELAWFLSAPCMRPAIAHWVTVRAGVHKPPSASPA